MCASDVIGRGIWRYPAAVTEWPLVPDVLPLQLVLVFHRWI